MKLLQKFTKITQGRAVSDETRRHKPDYLIIMFVGILSLLGLIVLFATSPAKVEQINLSGSALEIYHFMEKQLVYLAIGFLAFAVMAIVPLDFLREHRNKIFLAAIGACVLLTVLGVVGAGMVQCSLGACRWYSFGPLSFQPAEFLKFGLLVFMAGFLALRIKQGKVSDFGNTLVPIGIALGISLLLVIGFQKDMGTGIALIGIVFCMLLMAGLKLRYFAITVGVLLGFMAVFILSEQHRIDRVVTFLNPSMNTDGEGYHIMQAIIAIGSGGFFGNGLGRSVQAFGYLPEANNDSIFAILGETFGFFGLVVILLIFLGLFLRLLKIMDNVQDPYKKMLVAGVFGWTASQSIVNIGAMLGVLPLTGVTLPFLSFGGTSLLFVMMALGVIFQVSRYTSHQTATDEAQPSKYRYGTSTGRRTRITAQRGVGRV